MTQKILNLYGYFKKILNKLTPFTIILARISTGWVFASSGWGKLQSLENIINYFNHLGIPFAEFQAPMVAMLEFIGGIALILGLGTRIFSLFLAGIMAVALMTAHAEDIGSFTDLFKVYEYGYLLMLLIIASTGAKFLSLDYLMQKSLK